MMNLELLKRPLAHVPCEQLIASLNPVVEILNQPEVRNFIVKDFTYYRLEMALNTSGSQWHQALLLFCHTNETLYLLNTTCQSSLPFKAFDLSREIFPKFDLLDLKTIPFGTNKFDLDQTGYLSSQPKPDKKCTPSHTGLAETNLDIDWVREYADHRESVIFQLGGESLKVDAIQEIATDVIAACSLEQKLYAITFVVIQQAFEHGVSNSNMMNLPIPLRDWVESVMQSANYLELSSGDSRILHNKKVGVADIREAVKVVNGLKISTPSNMHPLVLRKLLLEVKP